MLMKEMNFKIIVKKLKNYTVEIKNIVMKYYLSCYLFNSCLLNFPLCVDNKSWLMDWFFKKKYRYG